MLEIAGGSILTPRLELRRTRIEDAAAMFDALRNPAMYTYLPRNPPQNVADIEERFRRVVQETAQDRDDQWLNWTVWIRETGVGIGMIEATVKPDDHVEIGYSFDPRMWRRGYGKEAVTAMINALRTSGAASFEASIDIRNDASKALARSLGFEHTQTRGLDEHWRRK
ncbi:MAG: GNAT family N-acetyltransferase [Hyphomonadaceae bacterium]|nr:GNAT family N-acetyltransferase [Hyphomonadaceae bacterium]